MYNYVRIGWLLLCFMGLVIKGCSQSLTDDTYSEPGSFQGRLFLTQDPNEMISKFVQLQYQLVSAEWVEDEVFRMKWFHPSGDILIQTTHSAYDTKCVQLQFETKDLMYYNRWTAQVNSWKKEESEHVDMTTAAYPSGVYLLSIWRTHSP